MAETEKTPRVRSWKTVAALLVIGGTLIGLQIAGVNVSEFVGGLFDGAE